MRRLSTVFLPLTILGSVWLAVWIQATAFSKISMKELVEPRWVGVYTALMVFILLTLGLPGPFRTTVEALKTATLGVVLTTFSYGLLAQIFGPWLLPRPVVLGIAPALTLTACYGHILLHRSGWTSSSTEVIFFGTKDNADRLIKEIGRQTLQPILSIRCVDVRTPSSLQLGGNSAVIVLDRYALQSEELIAWLADVHAQGIRVRTLTQFYEQWLGKLPSFELDRLSLLFDVGHIHEDWYRRLKRFFDIMVGLLGSPCLVVCTPLIAIGNLFGNRGTLFFTQTRVGENGRLFEMYKFRSMRESVGDEHHWTVHDDPRITRFGKVLRISHIDELPQLLNLIRGDISLVGPRPEQPHYVDRLNESIRHYSFRHSVKPGLTGWAQIRYPYASTEADSLEKLEYDLYYILNQGSRLDVHIMLKTVSHVLLGKGR